MSGWLNLDPGVTAFLITTYPSTGTRSVPIVRRIPRQQGISFTFIIQNMGITSVTFMGNIRFLIRRVAPCHQTSEVVFITNASFVEKRRGQLNLSWPLYLSGKTFIV